VNVHKKLTHTTQRPASCGATEGRYATAKILINLQTIEITDLIFPLRNTGGVGGAGSNPAVPTNLFNDLAAAPITLGGRFCCFVAEMLPKNLISRFRAPECDAFSGMPQTAKF